MQPPQGIKRLPGLVSEILQSLYSLKPTGPVWYVPKGHQIHQIPTFAEPSNFANICRVVITLMNSLIFGKGERTISPREAEVENPSPQ